MVEGVTMEAAESWDGTDPERTPVRSKLLIFYLKQIKNIIVCILLQLLHQFVTFKIKSSVEPI